MLSNRKKDTLKAFLGGLSEDIKHSIKVVAIDLWSTYRSATEIYSLVPDDLNLVIPQDVEGVFLTRVEADEMWSFVGHKGNRQWIGLALDITTRQMIACHIGGRLNKDAKCLRDLIPEVYKNDADFYTDQPVS